ncbi:glutamate NMDA receptor subunit [Echinococcus multilocularis]|uniref:Glutamate NMDA receptor subunit n=1 Tax=Echinococcus multilocularis TaxID=6211 RepID=A0A068Y3T7_ECHMU|nr:glutamate NMDA receptor subunit [Echinococcus multilocularis]
MLHLFAIFLIYQKSGFSQQDIFFNTSRSPRRYFNIAIPTNSSQSYVRLKLQAFIFEVTHYLKPEKGNASGHLRRLMKPYPHILLDPSYTSTLITSYHPLSIQAEICRQFQATRRKINEHVPTSIFVVNDIGAMVNRPRHDRLLQLFFQITASLGLPTLTWMPNRIGEFELEETQLATRLEPLTWHVARALVDFSQAFNWNIIILLYNTHAPGSRPLISELKFLQMERAKQDHPNYYEFEIDAYLPFDGFTKRKLKDCTLLKDNKNADCFDSLMVAMQKIWESISRVIIFNGNQYDLNALMYVADTLEGTENEHLGELFGTGYVWIFTPSTMAPLTIVDQVETVNRDNIVLSEFTMFRKIPGMFGLICLNDADNRKRHAELAREVWHKSLMELVKQMAGLFPPVKPINLNSTSAETIDYHRFLLEKLQPGDLCESSEHVVWQWGRRLNNIIRSLEMNFEGEPISFLPNGGLNVSKFLIFNSRTTNGRMNWFKVGTWSMSSKWGRSKSRLWIDGVTWPGGANSPPKGRAHRLKLKAVMLQEQPLLIYGNLQEDGSCDANSVPCWIRGDRGRSHKKLNPMVSIGKSLDGSKNLSFNERSGTRQERQLACCTGLTMDLLIELMKDLNFEVELYEVKDRLWGGWTKEGWNGLVRELMEHKADMAITSLKITPNRSEQIDFSVPFLETGIAITVALREGAISPTAFLEPYDYQCWCIILLFSVHASGAAIYLYEWLSPVGQDRGRLVTPEHRFTMCRSLWLIWSMLFGAAVNADNPRGMASRFMANIWALFALVFLASYTANLAAFMISKDDFYDLEGIHDWRLQQPWNHKPPFRFATVPSGATEENIKINFPEMAAYMRAFNRTTVIDGLKSLKSEEIDAFIYDATILGYWTSRDDGCKLKKVGNLYAMTGYGIGFPKGSRWLPKINSRILHYQKNGKFHRWKQFWLSGACKKVTTLGNTNKTLGVKNFISAFILLLCGMLLCGVIFLMEHFFYSYVRRLIQRSGHNGCCAAAVMKLPKIINMDNEELRKETLNLKNERHQEEFKNSVCLNERYRSKQEIAKMSRHLRFLNDVVTAKTENFDDRQGRNEAALPSSPISTRRSHMNTTEPCTVIRIPRKSWSNESYFNRKSHFIHARPKSSQNLRKSPSILRVPQKSHLKSVTDLGEKTKQQTKPDSYGKAEECKELANFAQSTTLQIVSPVPQLDSKTSKECVEKESVL